MTITEGKIDVAGRTRTYTLSTPPDGGYDRLLLVFHGSKQNSGAFRSFTSNAFDHWGGTGVAYLDGFQGNWNDSRKANSFPARKQNIDDVAFTETAVKQLGDGRPTFAVGYSNGGGMVIRLLHERPDLLDGGAVVAAQQPSPDNFVLPGLPVVPKPVLLFHGTKDRIVPYGGGQMAAWARFTFKAGGTTLSAPDTAAHFAARNGITAPPVTVELPHRAGQPDSTSVSRTDYRQDAHAPVTLYTVHDGGHTIPGAKPSPRLMGRTGADVHTTEAIAEFFAFDQ